MTVSGNPYADYGTLPPAGLGPALERSEPSTSTSRGIGDPDPRRVILRVHGDDDILVATAEGRENAVLIAREMVQHIEQASTRGEWPQIDERFIRPGAIVSIDVQRPE